jgi:hypothetical protein
MGEASISESSGVSPAPQAPLSTTIVHRPRNHPLAETGQQDTAAPVQELEWPWKLEPLPPAVPLDTGRTKVKTRRFTVRPVPDCVHAFVRAAAKIAGVRCVVVEDGEANSIHITTFLERLSDDHRQQVYEIEGATIRDNPTAVFDFHVRHAEEASGSLASIAGKHYYAVWGDLDASGK